MVKNIIVFVENFKKHPKVVLQSLPCLFLVLVLQIKAFIFNTTKSLFNNQ